MSLTPLEEIVGSKIWYSWIFIYCPYHGWFSESEFYMFNHEEGTCPICSRELPIYQKEVKHAS